MTKKKYALITIIAGVVLVIAAVLLMILTGPKETPWELTETLLPGEVQTAYVWDTSAKSASRPLTEDEITDIVHLINGLKKPNFKENSRHAGTTPQYGLNVICGEMELRISQVSDTKTEMSFDDKTAKTLKTDQWIINNAELAERLQSLANTLSNNP